MGETIWGLTAAIRPLACRGEQKFKRRPSVLPTARLAIPRLSVATYVSGDSTPRGNARKLFLSSSSLCSSAATDLPGFGPGAPVPTPRKNRLEENAWSVQIRQVRSAGSCSSNLMTPLPAWTRVVRESIEETTSRDSYPLLTSGMKILATLVFLS